MAPTVDTRAGAAEGGRMETDWHGTKPECGSGDWRPWLVKIRLYLILEKTNLTHDMM